MEILKNLLESYSFFGNSAWNYLVALVIFILGIIVLKIFLAIVLARIKKITDKTENDIDDVFVGAISGIGSWFYIVVSIFVAVKYLNLHVYVEKTVWFLFLVTVVVEAVHALERLIMFGIEKYVSKDKTSEDPDPHSESMVRLLGILVRAVLWVVALLLILSNLGVNITSLIASLGIGGIAIALALQNILSDMFSSFSLFIDKPFQAGDFIVVGQDSGTVKRIGLKTTRIKTLRGEELVISNKELTTARVQNLKKLESRRELVKFGVTYETSEKQLRLIPKIAKESVDKFKHVKFDRCHFVEYGDFSLIFELVYYVETSDYKTYLDQKQKINLAIFRKFDKEGISFAYPTQVVRLVDKR